MRGMPSLLDTSPTYLGLGSNPRLGDNGGDLLDGTPIIGWGDMCRYEGTKNLCTLLARLNVTSVSGATRIASLTDIAVWFHRLKDVRSSSNVIDIGRLCIGDEQATNGKSDRAACAMSRIVKWVAVQTYIAPGGTTQLRIGPNSVCVRLGGMVQGRDVGIDVVRRSIQGTLKDGCRRVSSLRIRTTMSRRDHHLYAETIYPGEPGGTGFNRRTCIPDHVRAMPRSAAMNHSVAPQLAVRSLDR